jgi:Fe-S cluster assembly protein SufB
MIKELEDKKVIFLDTDSALREYPELFKKYFNTLVRYDENKYTALNGAVWSGGTFIYIPPHTKLDRPLQSYFRINSRNMGQFERTLIIVDDNSELHYIEGCTAPTYTEDALHAAVVEIFVGKNSKCRYTTIQNWSSDVYNLVTKRAIIEENGLMEWIDGNIGSKANMKYPSCILVGPHAKGNTISIAVASKGQFQDTGARMIHLAPYTESSIISKSIAANGGTANYRGTVHITPKAVNSHSYVKCDTIIVDDKSKSDTIPKNKVDNSTSLLNHEATVSKISKEKLFYIMSRGVSEERAKELIIMGFIDKFREELPMEYAVELNALLKNYF